MIVYHKKLSASSVKLLVFHRPSWWPTVDQFFPSEDNDDIT